MKTLFRSIVILACISPLFFFSCTSLPKRFEPGYSPHTLSEIEAYNPDSVVIVTGKVVEATGFELDKELSIVTLIMEGPDKKRYMTQLGPSWYLILKDVFYEKGDRLTVEGSLLGFEEGEEEEFQEEEEEEMEYYLLLARKIEKEGKTIFLRTKSGKPRWYRKGRMIGIQKNIGKRRDLRQQKLVPPENQQKN